MNIVAALFIDEINLRQLPGPSTRIDLTGIQFSAVAPNPTPLTITPHLVVIIHCSNNESGFGALEVTYWQKNKQIARNVQPLQVDPGKFNYRLVRAELDFDDYGTIEARARVDEGTTVVVPYTLLPPV